MIEGLLLDGRNPDNYFNPLIYADRTILRGNEITNHHTTNCVHLSTYYSAPAPADVIIEGNNIHDCGTLPAQNHEHGIYIGAARNAIIRNNRIWSNADRGIQLFTDAQGTQIYGNVISGNGQGVLIAGYNGVAPNNTTVEHNIIAHSKVRHNVESSFDELTTPGTGNVFRENCIYGAEGWYRQPDGSGIQSEQVGFTATANVIADPGFANAAAGDFTVAAASGCAGVLDGVGAAPPPRLTLDTSRPTVSPGAATKLVGTAPNGVSGKATILRKVGGEWRPCGTVRLKGSRFAVKMRVKTRSHFKARATGVRDSKAVKVSVNKDQGKG